MPSPLHRPGWIFLGPLQHQIASWSKPFHYFVVLPKQATRCAKSPSWGSFGWDIVCSLPLFLSPLCSTNWRAWAWNGILDDLRSVALLLVQRLCIRNLRCGFILKSPGAARSIKVTLPAEQIPNIWGQSLSVQTETKGTLKSIYFPFMALYIIEPKKIFWSNRPKVLC